MKTNSSIKKITAVLFSALICSTVFAFDFGFLITDDTNFKTDENTKYYVDQKNDASAWIKIPFTKNAKSYFTAEAIYKFEFKSNTNTATHYLDLNLFKFVYSKELKNGSIELNAGRFFTADLSGLIFSQNSDGIFVNYKSDFINASLLASYTGLLNGNVVKQVNAPSYSGPDSKKIYAFQDKYIFAMATVGLQSLFADQNLSVQLLGGFDLSRFTYNRFYATLSLDGPIYKNLIYSLSGTCAIVANGSAVKVSPFVNAKIGYYFKKGSVSASCIFAGKDFDGFSSQTALNSFKEPEYKALIKTGLGGTFKPFDTLLVNAQVNFAFDGTKNYEAKGIEYSIGADFQVLSDVLVGLSWQQYFDINKTDKNYQCGCIKAKISL